MTRCGRARLRPSCRAASQGKVHRQGGGERRDKGRHDQEVRAQRACSGAHAVVLPTPRIRGVFIHGEMLATPFDPSAATPVKRFRPLGTRVEGAKKGLPDGNP